MSFKEGAWPEAYDTERLTVHDNRCRGCLKHITFPLHKRQTSFSLGEWHVMGGYYLLVTACSSLFSQERP